MRYFEYFFTLLFHTTLNGISLLLAWYYCLVRATQLPTGQFAIPMNTLLTRALHIEVGQPGL